MHKLLIVAGEPSGDLHASSLLRHIANRTKNITLYSAAGDKTACYSQQVCNLVHRASMGLVEVVKQIPFYFQALAKIERFVKQERPSAVILVDFPDFNLRLAQIIKRTSPQTLVIYYISPQVWAWRMKRVLTIQKYVDRMLVIFKFEEEFYRKHNIPTTFVGHPLLETVGVSSEYEQVRKQYETAIPVALMPGSRIKVIKQHLPVFLEAAAMIHKNIPGTVFFLIKPPNISEDVYMPFLKKYALPIRIISDYTYDYIKVSRFALVSSGTATVEVGILGTPFAILYKMHPLSFFLLKRMVHTDYIGMINIIFKKKVAEEFIQDRCTPENVAGYCINVLQQEQIWEEQKEALAQTRVLLEGSERTVDPADLILEEIQRKTPGVAV